MRLFVTIPYHSPTDLRRNREYVGQVARVELLDDDERAVAVQLLSSLTATPPTRLPGSSPP
jgi:hypothetical protein